MAIYKDLNVSTDNGNLCICNGHLHLFTVFAPDKCTYDALNKLRQSPSLFINDGVVERLDIEVYKSSVSLLKDKRGHIVVTVYENDNVVFDAIFTNWLRGACFTKLLDDSIKAVDRGWEEMKANIKEQAV